MLWRRPRLTFWSFPPYPAILRFKLTSSSKTRQSSRRRRQSGCGVSASCRLDGCDERAEQGRSADGLLPPLTSPLGIQTMTGGPALRQERWDTPVSDARSLAMVSLVDGGDALRITVQDLRDLSRRRFEFTFRRVPAYRNILEEYQASELPLPPGVGWTVTVP